MAAYLLKRLLLIIPTLFGIMLISFAIGTIAVATAVFFVNLYLPWIYYWSYAGIVMRLAANALEEPAYAPAPIGIEPAPRRSGRVRDAHDV